MEEITMTENEVMMNDELMFRKGTKYYRIKDDVVQIIRIVNFKNMENVVCILDEFYHDKSDINPDKTFTISRDTLVKDYRALLPNGQLCMTNIRTGPDQNSISDVLIVATKIDQGISSVGKTIAFGKIFVMCRQIIMDLFSAVMNPDNYCYGMSISRKTCPSNIDFDSLYSGYDPIDGSKPQFINIYQQDTINQILGLLKTNASDKILLDNYNRLKEQLPGATGIEKSVEDLVKNNGLIFDIYDMFDIIPIQNVTINYIDNNYVLSDGDLYRIEYVIKCRMKDILIVELNHFVSEEDLSEDYAHIKICDSSGKIYLIQYTPEPGFNEALYPEFVRNGMELLDKYKKIIDS